MEVWDKPERDLRKILSAVLKQEYFDAENRLDRKIIEVELYNKERYHHYFAYSGRVRKGDLQSIISYCKSHGISIMNEVPQNLGFKLPFESR